MRVYSRENGRQGKMYYTLMNYAVNLLRSEILEHECRMSLEIYKYFDIEYRNNVDQKRKHNSTKIKPIVFSK